MEVVRFNSASSKPFLSIHSQTLTPTPKGRLFIERVLGLCSVRAEDNKGQHDNQSPYAEAEKTKSLTVQTSGECFSLALINDSYLGTINIYDLLVS